MGSMPSFIVEGLGETMTNASDGQPLFESRIPIAVKGGKAIVRNNAMVSVSLLWVYWRDITKSLINDC